MTLRSLLCVALLLGSAQALAEATKYPLTVQSCNREVTFAQAPKHAVSHDINMTQMMLALGLKPSMAGYSGVTGWKSVTPQMQTILDGLPELAAKYPSVETLLNANVDFFFAGWDYGMRVGGDLTPQTLQPLGIDVYELTESCAFVMKRPPASLEDTYKMFQRVFGKTKVTESTFGQLLGRSAGSGYRWLNGSGNATPQVGIVLERLRHMLASGMEEPEVCYLWLDIVHHEYRARNQVPPLSDIDAVKLLIQKYPLKYKHMAS